MVDSPSTPLTTHALERLHKLADGNGLAPDAIKLVGSEEQTYTIEGIMRLEPLIETQGRRMAGNANNRGRQVLANFSALHTEVERRMQEFRNQTQWIPEAIKLLKEQ